MGALQRWAARGSRETAGPDGGPLRGRERGTDPGGGPRVKAAGATFLRGGAYKPRTSPYAFQGMEDEGFKLLRKAADATGLKVVSEVISHDQIDTAAKYCDMFQVGARNMQNFRLLRRDRPLEGAGAAQARHRLHD